jgi:hypothetical protein
LILPDRPAALPSKKPARSPVDHETTLEAEAATLCPRTTIPAGYTVRASDVGQRAASVRELFSQ